MRLFLIFSSVFVASGIAEISFVVKERMANGSFVGNIVDSADFPKYFKTEDLHGLKCSILRMGNSVSKYFTISMSTCVISTRESLYREILCEHKDLCLVELDVALSTDSSPVKIFPVSIIVEDINDNTPEFPEPEIHISIPESVDINTTFPITGATDADVGHNDVQTYEILPGNGLFDINVITNLDGTPEIGIVVRERLDREKMASYRVRVLAKDGGSPHRTGTLTVNIVVSDVNDHSPVFSEALYNVTVRENSPVNTPVVRVTASDRDEDVNGQVKYSFSSWTLSKYSHIFTINSTSGEISLAQTLDREEEHTYQLVVDANDQGNPPKSTHTLVAIRVMDVNDNQPIINFNFLSGEDQADIAENTNASQFIAYVSIKDNDSGKNSESDCGIDSEDFSLVNIRKNEFQVLSKSKLDRELQSQYSIIVTCQDKGNPPNRAKRGFIVNVLDENDNAPMFMRKEYAVLVREDLSIGEMILHLNAVDHDLGVNGNITYELEQTNENNGEFLINTITGEISVDAVLDREVSPEVKLHVIARDNGVPSNEAITTVVITILDVNDEIPVFNQSLYVFSVMENLPADIFVGGVYAADPDMGLGGEVEYSILESTGTGSMFVISPDKGEIRTAQTIDREEEPVINLTVIAKDKGDPSLSSTVLVSVNILDINDNAPVFVFPSNEDIVVRIDGVCEDCPITRLSATDLDEKDDIFFYSIDSQSDDKLFRINSSSGEIFMNRDIGDPIGDMFEVNVSVRDSGSPSLTTISILHINLIGEVMEYRNEQSNDINHIIAIIVLSVTIIVSSVIIAVICIIRRQDLHKRKSRSDGQSALGNKDVGTVPPPPTKKHVSFSTKQRDCVSEKEPDCGARQGWPSPNNSSNVQIIDNLVLKKQVNTTLLYTDNSASQTMCPVNHRTYGDLAGEQIGSVKTDYLQLPMEISCIAVEESLSEWSEGTLDSGRGGSMEWKVDIPVIDHNTNLRYNGHTVGHVRGLYI